jgi:hypothetical protein
MARNTDGIKQNIASDETVFESVLPKLTNKDIRFLMCYSPTEKQLSIRSMSLALINRHLQTLMKKKKAMLTKDDISIIFGVLDRTDPKQPENAGPVEVVIRRADPNSNFTPEK